MKKLVALLIALILGLFSSIPAGADVTVNSIDTPMETKIVEWAIGYGKRCRGYHGKLQPRNWTPVKRFARRVALAPLMLLIGTASAEGCKMDGVSVLNDGNPMNIGETEGFHFTVSPSTAKKGRAYRTDKPISLTEYEKKMPGVVVAQNRGMLFSSCRKIDDKYVIPPIEEMNIIVVNEVSRKLKPIDNELHKISWKGNGSHEVKDVIADGQGQHWFCDKEGKFADKLWLKIALFGYGIKGMLQPGLARDIGKKIIDRWGIERTITKGNTLLLNTSMVKGINAYDSLEDLVAHAKEWGLTNMMKQWSSGDHKPEKVREMGTQPNSTNLKLTFAEITELLKSEARKIWAVKYPRIAWMKMANINTSRGRAFAARPSLIYKDLIVNQINDKAGNEFRKIAQGKFKAEGQYLKMYMDKLIYSFVYVDGMDPNEAARKAASIGLHGELRVNPRFAGKKYVEDESGIKHIEYTKPTFMDGKGRYVEAALVRYPHGAPSETIVVKLYLDETVPEDVIIFPAPVANKDGSVLVKYLYALRLQGADFDGDAVVAFTEKIWLEAQKRNTGAPYMIIPINTESTEKDTTPVTDENWEEFCRLKVESLSNRVGLIATSLKYFLSQKAEMLRLGLNPGMISYMIVEHACAMGDDIDEFKHGKAENKLVPFVCPGEEHEETLYAPYFIRYSKKFKSEDKFLSATYYKDKNGNYGAEKRPGKGVLDMYATAAELLMEKCGIEIVKAKGEASDGTDRFYFTVNPAKWESKEVDLYKAEHGFATRPTTLPPTLEKAYGVKAGTALTAKDLFTLLYRDHAATCRSLVPESDEGTEEERDAAIKAIEKISERYALAKIAIVAWTKRMIKDLDKEDVTAAEAMKIFTTIMTQHNKKNRSVIETMTKVGKFIKQDGSEYEKTRFAATRVLNYFLDVCGDGLLLTSTENANFDSVSEKFVKAADATQPDIDEARVKALKELASIDNVLEFVPDGIEQIYDGIDKEELASIMDDGSMDLGTDYEE